MPLYMPNKLIGLESGNLRGFKYLQKCFEKYSLNLLKRYFQLLIVFKRLHFFQTRLWCPSFFTYHLYKVQKIKGSCKVYEICSASNIFGGKKFYVFRTIATVRFVKFLSKFLKLISCICLKNVKTVFFFNNRINIIIKRII